MTVSARAAGQRRPTVPEPVPHPLDSPDIVEFDRTRRPMHWAGGRDGGGRGQGGVLEVGRIVEIGTPGELGARDGTYARPRRQLGATVPPATGSA